MGQKRKTSHREARTFAASLCERGSWSVSVRAVAAMSSPAASASSRILYLFSRRYSGTSVVKGKKELPMATIRMTMSTRNPVNVVQVAQYAMPGRDAYMRRKPMGLPADMFADEDDAEDDIGESKVR